MGIPISIQRGTTRSRPLSSECPRCYWVDPIGDSRWVRLLERHPWATVFHTPAWLEALRRTYGYRPLALTSTPPGTELSNGWVFCDVNSWLTGHRLVSLPFSDHCDPLVEEEKDLSELLKALAQRFLNGPWKNIQVRPQNNIRLNPAGGPSLFGECQSYFLHKLDLRPSLDEIYGGFHKHSIRRNIRKAQRERLTYEEGRSEALMQQFYRLLLLTRRRHQLPPQPLEWFRNLTECLGEKAKIRVCYKNDRPIAAMITLTYKQMTVYKYGCSDARFHNLGAVPSLFWKVIQEGKQCGALELDLGRSDCDHEGLATFKEHLGGRRSLVTYSSYPAIASPRKVTGWKAQLSKRLFRWMPNGLLSTAGKMLYRHMG